MDEGPAEKAGVETGDVILEFNGVKVNSVDHLRNTVSASKPNRRYDLLIIRDGKKKTLKVRLEEMPGDEVLLASSSRPRDTNALGIEVSELNRNTRREFGISARDEGVVVTQVAEGSAAFDAGIQAGDLITRVGTKKCSSKRDFDRLIKETRKRNMVMLHLKRDGVARYLTLELDD